ncbi:hypothetical protein EC973_001724 [Apophysomyces ossiformis]|uniref:Alpha/beta hydrolase fold-3 domain-containing protein n=1 Tax=Apophysomyces ossiformis TaxID=679940 RepID=A0A8H7BTD6_9FUNG|nr:hypothetical protein EC973_001724 [Apophysomyces ossiformis]
MLLTLLVWNYTLSVAFVGLVTACAFDKTVIPLLQKHKALHIPLIVLGLSCSFVAELPLHVLLFKIIHVKFVHLFGGFDTFFPWLVYTLDLATMAGLVGLFIQAENSRQDADRVVRELDGKPIESFLSFPYLKHLVNPFYRIPLTVYPNITYATNEECTEAIVKANDYSQPRFMTLDVYRSSHCPDGPLRPVLYGSKNTFHPFEALLVAENNWVVVNIDYRLAPANAYPTHLLDVKRALRWVKQSIRSFGGDPNFVVLEGDSGGAQLAAMAAFTANQPEFQPGFEEVDTSVQGVISLSGGLDIQTSEEAKAFFAERVIMDPNVKQSFLDEHSPIHVLPKAGRDGKLVPFLAIAGRLDSLNDCSIAEDFKTIYDEGMQ